MSRLLRRCAGILCGLGLAVASAQAGPHSAVITWTTPADAVSGSAYNVYRASGACPASGLGSLTFGAVNASPVSALTYTDSTVTVGTYCFYVTQVQNGTESLPSILAGGQVRPNVVTITVTLN